MGNNSKRALQLGLCKTQTELTRTRNRFVREKSDKSLIDDVELQILAIKKARYELSSRTNKDSISMQNISFGKYFWDRDSHGIIKDFYQIR